MPCIMCRPIITGTNVTKKTERPIYLERVLFVIAPRHHGKSSTLRSMFLDRRLGREGKVPPMKVKKLDDHCHLSNERRLHTRLTSPHESNEDLQRFFEKTAEKMPGGGRWCFAAPLHPVAYKRMPDAVTTIDEFIHRFEPERVRVALLSPNHMGNSDLQWDNGRDLSEDILAIKRVEVIRIDVRQRKKNGLLLADFFDFT